MSPVPLIDLQRRLTLVGAIRAGGEKPARGVGQKLEAWRITSPRRQLVEQAATLYGGEVTEWQSPVGREFQVYTQAAILPVLLIPHYSVRSSYELWEGATKRTRLCDGVEEELSGQPCICNEQGVDKCDLYTRLVCALPELDTLLGWRVITRGANAGHELPTMMALVEAKAGGHTFVPARLVLDQRRGVKDGQVVRYVVPTLDLSISYAALAAAGNGMAQLPPGYTPAEPRDPTVAMAIDAVSGEPAPRTRRGPDAPFPPAPPITDPPPAPTPDEGVRPVPPPTPPPPAPPPPTASDEGAKQEAPPQGPPPFGGEQTMAEANPPQTRQRTAPQAKKLDTLVGKLRPEHITTEGLYAAIGGLRKLDAELMAQMIDGRDHEGMLHWAPLRDSLDRAEATQLIDWLEVKAARVGLPPAPAAGNADPGPEPGDPGPGA